ncbi:hypothetical protein D3C76_1636150 [compost metagenome]
MVDRLHINNRRRAAGDQLPDPEHGGIIQRFLIVGGFQRPDPFAQPVHQLQVIAFAAEQRLAEMNMCLYKAGNYRAVGCINNTLFPLR